MENSLFLGVPILKHIKVMLPVKSDAISRARFYGCLADIIFTAALGGVY